MDPLRLETLSSRRRAIAEAQARLANVIVLLFEHKNNAAVGGALSLLQLSIELLEPEHKQLEKHIELLESECKQLEKQTNKE